MEIICSPEEMCVGFGMGVAIFGLFAGIALILHGFKIIEINKR